MGEGLLEFWRWLQNTAQQAAIAEAPAVMTAAGQKINRNTGEVEYNHTNDKGVKQLRSNLAAIGEAGVNAPGTAEAIELGYNAIRHPQQTYKAAKELVKYAKRKLMPRKNNAAKITPEQWTPEQWTAAQDAAIARGDMAEAQRLRDLHFVNKSQNNKAISSEGMPLLSYHTVGDRYNPNFNAFNPEIEGRHSSIYTTDNSFMSGTYTTKITSEAERDKIIEVTRQRELDNYNRLLKGAQLAQDGKGNKEDIEFANKWLKIYSNPEKAKKQILSDHPWVGTPAESERIKRLYVNLENPLILDNAGNGWNHISLYQLPEDVYKLIKPDTRGNLLNASYTTRSLEEAQRAVGRYDGSIIKNVVDYGGQKQYGLVEPGTVFQVNNPNNIKLADAVTFDDNGVRIPLGKRDNFNINDIRYAFAPFVGGGIGYGLYNLFDR